MSTNQFNINFQNYSIFQSLEDHILFDRVPNVTFAVPRANAQNQHPAQMEQVQQSKFNSYRELILVDPIVENSDRLLAEGLESFADTIVEIYVLDAEQHGIAQISQLLSESDNQYDTVHIISDGAEGQITLGTSMLTVFNLNQYVDQMVGWSAALTENVTLHFYGSDLFSNVAGEQLANAISAILGATLGDHERESLSVMPR